MICGMIALSCPVCQNTEKVVRFGKNRSGTARCRFQVCKKTFTPSPLSRAVTPQKEAAIERLLCERIPL